MAPNNDELKNHALQVLSSLIIEDGRRWIDAAQPFQLEDAVAVLTIGSNQPYHMLTRARGNSKTSDIGAMALAVMLTQAPAGSKLYGMAADKDQARLLVDVISGYVTRDTTLGLRDLVKVSAYRIDVPQRNVSLEALAADTAGSWGLRPYFLVVDEFANWDATERVMKFWEAVSSAMTKAKNARMCLISSAGDPAHWSREVRDHAILSPLWRVHEVKGPPPWIDPEKLAEQRDRLPASVYARLFMNEWTASEDRLASWEDIQACVRESAGLAEVDTTKSYVFGVDVGLKHDRTVVSIVHQEMGDDEKPIVVLDEMKVWQGTPKNPVQLSDVEAWVFEEAKRYNYARIVLDPWQSVGMAQRLAGEFTVEEYLFTATSVARLANSMLVMLRDHRLYLPDDPEILNELANVRLRETSPGVLRMDHDPSRHDDRAISLALAVQDCIKKPVFDWASAYGLYHCTCGELVKPDIPCKKCGKVTRV